MYPVSCFPTHFAKSAKWMGHGCDGYSYCAVALSFRITLLGEGGVVLRRIEPRLGQRLRDRNVDHAGCVSVKHFARVAGYGRLEKSVDEIATGEERMAVPAIVLGRDGPEAGGECAEKGEM